MAIAVRPREPVANSTTISQRQVSVWTCRSARQPLAGSCGPPPTFDRPNRTAADSLEQPFGHADKASVYGRDRVSPTLTLVQRGMSLEPGRNLTLGGPGSPGQGQLPDVTSCSHWRPQAVLDGALENLVTEHI